MSLSRVKNIFTPANINSVVIIYIENNIVKNPNWQEAVQLAIYKRSYREKTPASG